MSFYQMDPPDPDPYGEPEPERDCPVCSARPDEDCEPWCLCERCIRQGVARGPVEQQR